MMQFFSSVRALDAVLAVVTLEFMVLALSGSLRMRWRVTPEFLAHLWAAGSLLAASHLIITRQWGGFSAMALLSALLAHIVAFRLRWKKPPQVRLQASAVKLQLVSSRSSDVSTWRSGAIKSMGNHYEG